jgi:uncharacterized protein YjiS (DUF1127 family)
MFLSLMRTIQHFIEYNRDVTELSNSSDRDLADMGICRSEISHIASGSFADGYSRRTR